MFLFPTDARAMVLPRRLERLLGYGAVGLGSTALVLALMQTLLARPLERNRLEQRAGEVVQTVRLLGLALESLPPEGVLQLSGLPLRLQPPPAAPSLAEQVTLQRLLCRELKPCPVLLPARTPVRGVWLALATSLEPLWLLVPLPSSTAWPPDPALLLLAMAAGGGITMLVYVSVEIEQPLRHLRLRLDVLDEREADLVAQPRQGTAAVRALAAHLAAARQREQQAARERTVMLAGLAHDLRAPLTRLRLRQSLQTPDFASTTAAANPVVADLDALERLIDQFLAFVAAERSEAPVLVPLEQLLAEVAAPYPPALTLQLTTMRCRVPPNMLARAVTNLLDNALCHGRPPFLLRLLSCGGADQGFAIEVWDGGNGIALADWPRALEPFQRLDAARQRRGHGGLGLAIAQRGAKACGGELVLLHDPSPELQALGLRSGVGLNSEISCHNCLARQL